VGANTSSAEHASEGRPDRNRQDDTQELRQEQPSAAVASRHLYIVHSADAPKSPSIMKSPPMPRQGKSNGMLDRSVQVQIGRMLRDVFADVAEEPVPERFVMLLEALQAKEQKP
jgi:anti-sigma factor NepR-like protein